jgi:hypothetical protein
MLTEYSKSPADVATHTAQLLANNDALLQRQRKIASGLSTEAPRKTCLLCESTLGDTAMFNHRGVSYCQCGQCGHIQCECEPQQGYPYSDQDFTDIYPPLDESAYASRTERIYRPKLDWMLRASRAAGLDDLLLRSWVELGSGAGHFVSAVCSAGGRQVAGLESEPMLVAQAAASLEAPLVQNFSGTLAEAVRHYSADIYVAWFVLEHCTVLPEFLDALRQKPPGTVFAFSVPVLGFATLLEAAFSDHYARSLDSVLHLQLFTDRSIEFAMERAGYGICAEWIFGQDADDLYRAIAAGFGRSGTVALQPAFERLIAALPVIQSAIDQARLSDARHILAVRK